MSELIDRNHEFTPVRAALSVSGELSARAARARELAGRCVLCPRRCRSERSLGATGSCGVDGINGAPVARALPHFGEEPPLTGKRGSGTVFFGGCGLRCVFCQNHQISHLRLADNEAAWIATLSPEELADKFLELQQSGCHNLNLVTGSAHLPAILSALHMADRRGFNLPLVWNSGGYETEETLALLDGVVDIYLPDMKFGRQHEADLLTRGSDYVEVNRRTVSEMFRQAGLLETDSEGIARRGLIVRHLILPGSLAGTRQVLEFLSREISRYVHLSLMSQYCPTHHASEIPALARRISPEEYSEACGLLEEFGLENGWVQELESVESYRPDFTREDPFGT